MIPWITFSWGPGALGADPPLSRWREGVDVCSSLETFMNMAHSHQDHFVGMNIPVIITCQGDISELGFDDCCLLLMASLICAEQSQLWWNMTYSISYKQLAIHYRQHSAYMQYFYDGQRPWWWTKYLCMDLLVIGRSNCYSIVCVGHIHVMMESALYTIWKVFNVFCTVYTLQCTLYTVHCKLYTVYCTLNTVHCTQYTIPCTQ